MELFRLVCSNSSCWHTVFTDGVSQYCTFTQAQTRCTIMCHLPILVDCIFISSKCTFLLTRCGVVYHWDLSLLYYQVQKWVYVKTGRGKSVQHSLKQNEYSGSVPFVVALIGCFLRKLLRPVCAKVQSESTEYFSFVLVYQAQPLPRWAFLTSRSLFQFVLLHHVSRALHMLTQPWASTQHRRE